MNWIERIDFKHWTIANFVILAFFGALLRYIICFPTAKLNFMYILQAHSHFAFSAWIFMALALLIAGKVLEPRNRKFQWLMLINLICSFGMLISFTLQGYKLLSIAFSTAFLFLTYWFGYLIYCRLKKADYGAVFSKLILAALFFLIISSAGPLALGFLKATGNTGSIYQNAIYFYLHFQMNGWMLFGVLALLAGQYLKPDLKDINQPSLWLNTFILSSLPLFFIFTLWSKPPLWIYYTATLASVLNIISWFALLWQLRNSVQQLPFLVKTALAAISFKLIFQVLICIPIVGDWAFSSRNLIIGYVHLLTLGAITPILITQFNNAPQKFKRADYYYTAFTVVYLILLFIQPLLSIRDIIIPFYQLYLLITSVLFCLWGLLYYHLHFRRPSTVYSKPLNTKYVFYESNN